MLHKLCFLLLLGISFQLKAGLITDSLLIDGHYRVFHFNEPSKKGASLIFALHGSGGNAQQMIRRAAALEAAAPGENLAIVYPEGYKTYWNECRKFATTVSNLENIDENTFFSRMIAYFKSRYGINDKRVFAIGFSGGGHMAYKLALTMPGQFRAVTAIVANLPDTSNLDCIEARKPVAVMIVNGTADPVNPYNGGEIKSAGLTLGYVRSTGQTLQYWATLDGYDRQPAYKSFPDKDTSDDVTIEQYTYRSKRHPEVILFKVINGKHEFPKDMDVFTESWAFFRRQ